MSGRANGRTSGRADVRALLLINVAGRARALQEALSIISRSTQHHDMCNCFVLLAVIVATPPPSPKTTLKNNCRILLQKQLDVRD